MLQGKNAFITGSTSGIGLAIASALAAKGANLILNGFGEENAIKTMLQTLQETYKIQIFYHPANMAIPAEIHQAIIFGIEKLQTIDILVNNAGIQHVAPITEFPDDKWQAILDINLSSSFHTIKAVLPYMRKQNFGRIINIASAHGLVASPHKAAYVAAKHGLLGLTKVVALETAKENITCNAVCPGWVLTPLVQKQIEEKAKNYNISLDQATENLIAEKQPSQKFVQPNEIGELVAFLASDHAANIKGASFSIDGGWTAQ